MSRPRELAIARLAAAMAGEQLYEVHRYDDTDEGATFTVIEYGDPLEGRAFIVTPDGAIEETDR